jgi:hypothetical protein
MTISQLRWFYTVEWEYELCILKAAKQLIVIPCYYPDICLNGTEENYGKPQLKCLSMPSLNRNFSKSKQKN